MDTKTNFEFHNDSAACGLIAFRLDGSLVYANNTLVNWLNTTSEEILKKKLGDLLIKGGKLYYNLFVLPLLQLDGKVDEINFEIEGTDGSFPILFSASKIQSLGDEGLFSGVVFKISDRKKYEAEILKEKNIASEQSLRKTKALLDIAFNQAHLIRAPLANILGLVDLFDENDDIENIKHVTKAIKESAIKLDRVVKSLIEKSSQAGN
jgi:sigma-B regulation protein RsbU (phosphoserine phosphatase)